MTQETYPLLPQADTRSTIAWYNGIAVSQQQFLQQAKQLAQRLPQNSYAINLCEDRYHFLLVFAAMLLRGKTCLLPGNRSVSELQNISSRHDDCPCIVDKWQADLSVEQYVIEPEQLVGEVSGEIPALPAAQICAVVFTSGSTGQSVAWEKTWGELYRGAKLTRQMLALDGERPHSVVATVPPQHMYGLETSIILPLVTGMSVYSGRPFFPPALQHALHSLPEPRIMITTPVHLRACIESGIDWPAIDRIVSATAPLPQMLAQRAEQVFDCTLQEIYGSTETGAVATRRTSAESSWTLHQGVQIQASAPDEDSFNVSGGHLPRPMPLHDRIRLEGKVGFTLLGRNSDMVKIAGKRVSLGDLNHKLLAIPGVQDGVFIETLADERQAVSRLCALVVAPALSQRDILEALRMQIDPVCLPRPLYQVPQLPRTEAGKLPRKAILEMLAQLGSEGLSANL